jgi:hypothetical protein
MKKTSFAYLLIALIAACGDSSSTDPGTGTKTLLVRGHVDWESDVDAAELRVSVRRGDINVTDAAVIVHSDLGDVTLIHDSSSGDYIGVQAGWASYYALSVRAGEDRLDGSIDAPEVPQLTSPDPTVAFDPHDAPDGIITVHWSGSTGDSIRVRYMDFEYEGVDSGHLDVPATVFTEADQELELRRGNAVTLAGGLPGSELSARCEETTTVVVVNPF